MTSAGASRSLLPFVAIGVLAGTLSGLLGVGGGIVIVPALMFAAAVPQRVATSTSLAAVAPIAIAGSVLFGSSGNVEIGTAVVLAIGSVIGTQAGTRILRRAPEQWLRWAFALYLIASAFVLILR
jgi:uncharacterized membrane protein YfcA